MRIVVGREWKDVLIAQVKALNQRSLGRFRRKIIRFDDHFSYRFVALVTSDMKTNRRIQILVPTAAFTIVELVVVIVVILIIAGLTLPVLSRATERAQGIRCSENLKELGLAWALYAQDHEGRVALNRPTPDWNITANWASGWLDKIADNTDNTNRNLLEEGQLGLYVSNLEAYKCPGDRLTVEMGGVPMTRLRSVAMNFYVGFQAVGRAGEWQEVLSTSDMVNPDPQTTFILAVQREDGINDTWYRVDADRGLVENPASYHNGGDNLVFGDGHVELHRWIDPRTTPSINRSKSSWHVGPNVGEGWAHDNVDINWLRHHASATKWSSPSPSPITSANITQRPSSISEAWRTQPVPEVSTAPFGRSFLSEL